MNVKPGDLAIQIKSWANNQGKICKVIGPMGYNPLFEGRIWLPGEGFCWMVEYHSPIKVNHGFKVKICPCPDSWLRPVSGLPDEQHTEEDNKLEA